MHFNVCIPIKKDTANIPQIVMEKLEPFSMHKEVEPYRVDIIQEERERIAESFELRPDDLEALAGKLKEWDGFEGHVDEKGLYQMRTNNPNSRYDWGGSVYETKTAEELIAEGATEEAIISPEGKWIKATKTEAWKDWGERFRNELGKYKSTDGYIIALADCHY